MSEFTVLSCDPGTKNFAAALITGRMKNGTLNITIHGTKVIDSTIHELKDNLGFSLRNFLKTFDTINENHGTLPDAVYMERFQSRGLGGTTIECINFMLGSMVLHYHEDTDVKLITAATWKNRANKMIDLKSSYKDYNLHRVITDKTAHELDATLIGIYACCRHFEIQDFDCFKKPGSFPKFMEYFLKVPSLKV